MDIAKKTTRKIPMVITSCEVNAWTSGAVVGMVTCSQFVRNEIGKGVSIGMTNVPTKINISNERSDFTPCHV